MGITVEFLQKIRFSQLPIQEKIRIKSEGRPTPDIIIRQTAVSKNKQYIRSFNYEWYEKIEWLCGCEARNALFCFPCLLYGGDTVWTESGFTNISRIKDKCENHQNSLKHMENVVSLSLLGQINISKQLSEAYRTEKLKHNQQVKKNREMLSKIIDWLKFCGKFELLLREQDDSEASEKSGVFEGSINYMGTFDPSLQELLDNSSVFIGTSKTIQKELLQNMLEVCQEHIATEIDKTSHVVTMIDDTTDVSQNIQSVIVFRYELDGVIYERFWAFLTRENVRLSHCLLTEMNKVLRNNSSKLIGVTDDGSCFIDPEQEKLQQIFPNAHFIHSYAHQLTPIVKNVSATIKPARVFFANLLGIASFFSESQQRLDTFELPKSNIPWNFHVRTVNTVFENKDNLLEFFEELQSLQTTDKTIQASTAFLELLKNETFLFWLELYDKIMPHMEILFSKLQSRDINGDTIQMALNEFYTTISGIRNSTFCESGTLGNIIGGKEVCDRICQKTQQRFAFTTHLIAAKLFYQERFEIYCEELPLFEIKETCNEYSVLVQDKLETELKVFYSRKEFHNFNGLLALLNLLSQDSLASVFTEVIKLLKILVTIPMATSEPGRCFSTLKRIKSILGNSMNQEQLTALSMISIEKNMISQIKNFNEKVIEKFCQTKNQRIDFIFK